ncbi:hypothetical protein CLOM_g19897 [Closterium sp. NIES-68]|nr:hypothetical protein CLOM_g19897 [Closterium sp. NIES-68]
MHPPCACRPPPLAPPGSSLPAPLAASAAASSNIITSSITSSSSDSSITTTTSDSSITLSLISSTSSITSSRRPLHRLHHSTPRAHSSIRDQCAREKWQAAADPCSHTNISQALVPTQETTAALCVGGGKGAKEWGHNASPPPCYFVSPSPQPPNSVPPSPPCPPFSPSSSAHPPPSLQGPALSSLSSPSSLFPRPLPPSPLPPLRPSPASVLPPLSILVSFSSTASTQDKLKALLQVGFLQAALSSLPTSSCSPLTCSSSSSSTSIHRSSSSTSRLAASVELQQLVFDSGQRADACVGEFIQQLEGNGWLTKRLLLAPDEQWTYTLQQ